MAVFKLMILESSCSFSNSVEPGISYELKGTRNLGCSLAIANNTLARRRWMNFCGDLG